MDAHFYGQMSDVVWLKIYDYHIQFMSMMLDERDTFIGAYAFTLHSHAIRDMERQALLGELRRANWQPTYTKPSNTVPLVMG